MEWTVSLPTSSWLLQLTLVSIAPCPERFHNAFLPSASFCCCVSVIIDVPNLDCCCVRRLAMMGFILLLLIGAPMAVVL